MKNLRTLVIMMIFPLMSQAQAIPNAGFESWLLSQWFEFPEGWETNNTSILAPTVVKDSDEYSGNLAMMLTNQGALRPFAGCGFEISTHPVDLGGYVKNYITSNDSAIMIVHLFSSGVAVDSGMIIFYGQVFNPNWTSFTIPISQTRTDADSCHISIYGGNLFSSTISFDDLELDFTAGIPVHNREDVKVYPNPFNDYLYIEGIEAPITVTVTDLLGRKSVECGIIDPNFCGTQPGDYKNIRLINTENLHDGYWLLEINSKSGKQVIQIIRQ